MAPKGNNVISGLALRAVRSAATASSAARSAAAASRAARRIATDGDRSLPLPVRRLPQGQSTLPIIPSATSTVTPPPPSDEQGGNNDMAIDPNTPPAVVEMKGRDKFVAEEKDMESDEALWALYERWCKHFEQQRSRDEMARRFGVFKSCVLQVHQVNRAGLSYRLAITKNADTPLPSKYSKRWQGFS